MNVEVVRSGTVKRHTIPQSARHGTVKPEPWQGRPNPTVHLLYGGPMMSFF